MCEEEREGESLGSLTRAVLTATLVAAVLAVLLGLVAWYAPYVMLNFLIRTFVSLLVAWLLFSIVHARAGFTGWQATTPVVVLALLVMLSNHVAFAVHGVVVRTGGVLAGWAWFDPLCLIAVNLSALLGIGACTALRHNGGGDVGTLVDILMRR